MAIIFFDFPSKASGPWNPVTWKTRYTLNYKGIPYQTEWVEYTQLESVCKAKGIPPSADKEGAPFKYTLPAILDTRTGVGICESYRIAEYLDKTYPDTPKVILPGTEVFQATFMEVIRPHVMPLYQFCGPATLDLINDPDSREYYYKSRTAWLKRDLKEARPKGATWEPAMQALQSNFDTLDKWLVMSSGPYVTGNAPSLADFALAGWIKWAYTALGEDSKEWQAIVSWNEGRWVRRYEQLERYANAR